MTNVIELAKQAGIPHVNACRHSLERFATLVRNAALEEAALILEQQHTWISNVSAAVLTRNLKEPTT